MLSSIPNQTIKFYKNISDLIPNTLKLLNELSNILLKSSNDENSLKIYKLEFRKKVSCMFLTTPYVLRTDIQNEFFIQDGIKFLIRLFKHDIFASKEYSIDKNPSKSKSNGNSEGSNKQKNSENKNNKIKNKTENDSSAYFDPFAPPFKENFVVEENFNNLNTHRIFFSKYPVMDEHLLIVTREFFSQYNHLTFDNIKNAVTLAYVMDGIVFFNAGKKAGASQIRKHMQCVPLEKLYQKDFGLFLLVNDEKNLTLREKILPDNIGESNYLSNGIGKIFSINLFENAGINHVLIKFSEEFTESFRKSFSNESIDAFSKIFFELYNLCLIDRGLVDLDSEESVTKDYSFLFTDEWMLVVPRRTHEVHLNHGKLNINSIGFLLMFMCNNKELVEEVKGSNLLKDVFNHLTEN